MKRILVFLALVLWAGGAEGATIYAKPSTDNTSLIKYSSDATSCTSAGTWTDNTDLEAALTAAGASGTLNICAGTYTGTMIDATDGLDFTAANQTVQGATGNADNVIFDGTGLADHLIYSTKNGSSVKHITFQAESSGKYGVAMNATGGVTEVAYNKFLAPQSGGFHLAMWNGTTNAHHNQFLGGGSIAGINTQAVYVANFCYNIIRATASAAPTRWLSEYAGTANVYNNIFSGHSASPLYTAVGGNLSVWNIKNNLFMAGNSFSSSAYLLMHAGVTGVVSNNYFGIIPRYPGNPVSGTALTVGTNRYVGKTITRGMKRGYVAFSIDDYASDTWAYLYGTSGSDGVVSEFVNRGMKLTWYIDIANGAAQDNYATNIAWAKNHNVEIGIHGRSSTDLSLSDGTKIWDTSGNVTIDRASDSITTAGGTVAGFKAKTLTAILAELRAAPHSLTVTPTAIYNTYAVGGVSGSARGEVLKDSGPGTTVLIKVTDHTEGLLKSEIVDAIDQIEAIDGVGAGTIKSISYPFGTSSAAALAAVLAAKSGQLTSGRGTNIGESSSPFINGLTRANIASAPYTLVKTDTPAGDGTEDIKAYIDGLCAWAAEMGGLVVINTHNDTNYTKAQIATMLDQAAKWQGIVETKMSVGEAMADILTYATDTDGTLSYTWTDAPDYRLRPGSVAINAGANVGLVSDFSGRKVPKGSAPEIGAYEFYGSNRPFGQFTTFPSFPNR
jgi:hypothetical protein